MHILLICLYIYISFCQSDHENRQSVGTMDLIFHQSVDKVDHEFRQSANKTDQEFRQSVIYVDNLFH